MDARQQAKVLCLCIAFVVITVCTALPIVLAKWFYNRGEKGLMALRIMRCFGGGAFLGAFLLHVLPEVAYMLGNAFNSDYPFANLIVGGGFFMIFLLEKLVHFCTAPKDSQDEKVNEKPMELAKGRTHSVTGDMTDGVYNSMDPDFQTAVANTADDLRRTVRSRTLSEGKPPPYVYESHHAQSHAHAHAIPMSDPNATGGGALAKSVIMLFALSLDCIMEGMALGLQETSAGVWSMLMAILSHEFIIGFTLGLQLLRHNTKKRVLFLAIFYGLTCPLGIAIGTIISEVFAHEGNFDLISGIFQAITGGVFIYVTFFEILADEISSDVPLGCIMSVALGFGMMALLMIAHGHGHSHGGDDGHGHSHGGDDGHGHSHGSDDSNTTMGTIQEAFGNLLR